MSLGEWLAVAGIIVAVVAAVAAVLATRYWGNRRRRLLFSLEAAPLLPAGQDHGPLQITYRDTRYTTRILQRCDSATSARVIWAASTSTLADP